MATMSDSQYEFEYNEDFYDDVSSDDNNNQNDSGMEEKTLDRNNNYDAGADTRVTRQPKIVSADPNSTYTKKNNNKSSGSHKRTPGRSSDPYMSYVPSPLRKPKKPPGSKGSSSKPMVNNSTHNTVIKRVLSASRKKTTTLNNVIYELEQQCEALMIENRDLKRNARVQDRDLRKLDGAEAQLPVLMKKHSNELNVLQEKYKRQKEMSTSLTDNLKRTDLELLKTKDKLKEYQSMVKEKNLGERIELRNSVLNLEKVVEEKEMKISELNRTITLQKKMHGRVVKERNDKYEKAMEKVKGLEESQNNYVSRIKDLEKALEVTYIYSRRKHKDGKQMVMFSSQDPIPPVLKKCLGEDQAIQVPLIEKNDEDVCSVKSFVGDQIDTMVSKNEHTEEVIEHESTHTEETPRTFLTEGKFKMEESDDFYNSNESKEISIIDETNKICPITKEDNSLVTSENYLTTKEESSMATSENYPITKEESSTATSEIYPITKEENSTTISDIDSLRDEELHKKLDKMDEERDKTETVELTIHYKEQENLKEVKVSSEIERKKEESRQIPLEKSMETMEIVDRKRTKVNVEPLDEEAKARKLLLAKIQAIDKGENPNEITEHSLNLTDKRTEKKSKLDKKPIFLQSSMKSSLNTSDDNITRKSLDVLSGNNSKPNSGSSKPPRNRQLPDSYSGNEESSSWKSREEKDLWEFKKTDDNLHKGLPSHTSILLSPQTIRSNDLPSNHKANKNRINAARYENDHNTTSRHYDTSYSPTVLNTNTGSNRKTSKKNNGNLFEQFEDPFKKSEADRGNAKTNEDVSTGNLSMRKKSKPVELFSRTGKNSLLADPMVMDDLEEMFIL